ncbi:MAG: aminodeoxychorismate/anthranilate synthase component II [Armatimonadetes bacterium]|nr:aminodeoxychorismate/anthranilate synthase component II [Armatimonadota bacterium]MDI9603359.1 aminodeoxychorismate/anthranilate synthase component II [Acidobacteriota bacterium]NLN91552.1 aminodeoxychorismate/anthranilate synthase component II [candidate division WS1 bacterium]
MILVIDNYDSFTYNLVQYLGEMTRDVVVRRNDQVTLDEIEDLGPDRICISPGPRTPLEAGISCDVIRVFGEERGVPTIGVCLGHQCIGHELGGKVVRAQRLMHGKTSPIEHDGRGLFADLPSPFTAVRYHSLLVERESLPDCLVVSARTADQGEVMGVRHRRAPVEGVQFHPESIMTEHGRELLRNFVEGKIGSDAP